MLCSNDIVLCGMYMVVYWSTVLCCSVNFYLVEYNIVW